MINHLVRVLTRQSFGIKMGDFSKMAEDVLTSGSIHPPQPPPYADFFAFHTTSAATSVNVGRSKLPVQTFFVDVFFLARTAVFGVTSGG